MKPTLRQGMILVFYVALVGAAIRQFGRPSVPGLWGFGLILLVFVVLGLPVLGLLIRLIDHPGPRRSWLSTLLMSLFLPTIAVLGNLRFFDDIVLQHLRPPPSRWLSMLAMNVFLLWYLVVDLPALIPRICRNCGGRAVIPVDMTARRDSRALRRCTGCGAEFGGCATSGLTASGSERASIHS